MGDDIWITRTEAKKIGLPDGTIQIWGQQSKIRRKKNDEGIFIYSLDDITNKMVANENKRKFCRICNVQFDGTNKCDKNNECLECYRTSTRELSHKRRRKNPESFRQQLKKCREKTKRLVFNHYSQGTMTCAGCGFCDMRALSIDHINGKGRQHRREIGASSAGGKIYTWLKRNGFPDGFQVLCMNCQFIKRHESGENN